MELAEPANKTTEDEGIPIDWEVEEIGNLVSITTGNKNTQDRIEDGEYPFFVRSQTIERIDTYSFDGEAVLTAGDGVGTGKVFHYINGKFDFHQRVYLLSNFDARLNGFYFYLYFSTRFFDRIRQMTAKSSVDSVRRDMISKMKIHLPPLREQIAIATALSDINRLIISLESLVDKKRLVYQGVMQTLLRPREGWAMMKLGELARIFDGTHQTPKYVDSGIPFYSVENVTEDNFTDTKFISEKEHESLTRKYRIRHGDLLMTRIGSIGDFKYVDWDANASFYVSLALLKVNELIDPQYLYFYSFTSAFKKSIELNSLQSAIPKKINLGQIQNVEIFLPPKEEQIKISQVLSEFKVELSALEQKLVKYKMIKDGMLKTLLTGTIRLI